MVTTESGGALDEVRRRQAELDTKIRALRSRTFDGADPGQVARVTVDGDGRFVGVRLDRSRLDDVRAEEVADAVLAALGEARRMLAEALREVVGGPPLDELRARAANVRL
jgi:DNA-binding protein YbaB